MRSLEEELSQEGGQVATGDSCLGDGVRDGETLVDGAGLANTITRVEDDTSGTTGGVKGENTLHGNVHGGDIEVLEHNLGHLLSVNLGVVGSLSKEDAVLIWGCSDLVIIGVVPDLLHVVPVLDDTVLNGVRDLKIPLLSLITYVLIVALNTN